MTFSPLRPSRIHLLSFTILLGASLDAHAQVSSTFLEQYKLIKAPKAVASIGPELFGDQVNLYNGALEFVHTDVSLPGNNALPVSLGRRLLAGRQIHGKRAFGQWNLDIPHLHGVFAKGNAADRQGWTSADGSNARCSGFGVPAEAKGLRGTSKWAAHEFWQGSYMYVPGAGDQQMLRRAPEYTKTPAAITVNGASIASYPVVTAANWSFGCLPKLANDASPGKTMGEGFLAVAPDGTRYQFDQMVSYAGPTLTKAMDVPQPAAVIDEQAGDEIAPKFTSGPRLPLVEVWLLPTKLTDRYGNTVTYTYDAERPANLTGIASSDGRKLTITYKPDANNVPSHLIETVSDGSQTWRYGYDGSKLSTLTLPDQSAWQFAGISSLIADLSYGSEPSYCSEDLAPVAKTITGSMVHPSGATGSFTMTPTAHGRSDVPRDCIDKMIATPIKYYTHSLTSKAISGPGIGELVWAYDYGAANGSFSPCTDCVQTESVSVTNPEGNVTRYTFGNRFFSSEGKLLQTDVGWDGSTALRSTVITYRAPGKHLYPAQLGTSDELLGDGNSDLRIMPQEQRTITQQGVTFIWKADQFDEWARPTQVTRSSSLGATRTETQDYEDNLSKWVLRQPRTLTESSTGKAVLVNEYDSITANLKKVTRFGRIVEQMTYNTDGTLATYKDGNGHKTTFSKYKRGIAQQIDYPDGGTLSAVVNDSGTIATITDANSFTTAYSYDAANRLAGMTPPAGDSVAWKPTINVYAKNPDQAYGLAPGHWVQTSQTGNAQTKTYYDAFFRPVVIHTVDVTEPLVTARFVSMGYDSAGHTTFTAYPQRSFEELANGVHQQYDALGRKTTTGTNSEHGTIYSGNSYGDQFSTTYTTGRGHDTTTSYQVFDEPTDSAAVSISAPEGVSLSIHRDLFGKPLSVTRSGHGKSATRSYVYDDQQRLCKTIEPETGATVQHLDGANNTLWRASGLTLLLTDQCETDKVLAKNKTSFGYDKVNRLLTTSYGDGSPGVSRTYTPDGLPKTVNSDGANWTYEYNRRRLLETETLAYASQTYKLKRG